MLRKRLENWFGAMNLIMPESLTAKNGAKALMVAEFSETERWPCVACNGNTDDCETCGGSGECELETHVSWTTIKAIYDKAVKHLGRGVPQCQGT